MGMMGAPSATVPEAAGGQRKHISIISVHREVDAQISYHIEVSKVVILVLAVDFVV